MGTLVSNLFAINGSRYELYRLQICIKYDSR